MTLCATLRTHRSKNDSLLDHLVGASRKSSRHLDAKRSSSAQIDHKLERSRLQDRQIGRLFALEDATGIDAHLTIRVVEVCTVAHQPPSCGKLTPFIDRR